VRLLYDAEKKRTEEEEKEKRSNMDGSLF